MSSDAYQIIINQKLIAKQVVRILPAIGPACAVLMKLIKIALNYATWQFLYGTAQNSEHHQIVTVTNIASLHCKCVSASLQLNG